MGRKPKPIVEQSVPMTFIGGAPAMDKPSVAAAAPIASVPSLVEYEVAGRAWRCGRFDSLVTELGEPRLSAEGMPLLQPVLAGLDRSWKIVRRLFGIMPVMPPADYPMEDMRSWGRDELCAALGMKRSELQQELDGVRGLWRGLAPKPELEKHSTFNTQHSTSNGELPLEADRELLEKHGLAVSFNDGERTLFLQRVRDFEKVLKEKTTAGLARNILMTELQILRIDRLLADSVKSRTGSTDWRANMNIRSDLDRTYRDQLEQLRKLAPWFSAVGGKHTFAGTLSDVTAAMCAYYGNGDAELADGIFTVTEIQVEQRRSLQAPDLPYRAGWVVYANMAKAFLFNPNWRNRFPASVFKKLDVGYKAAVTEQDVTDGAVLPDLENGGEHADIILPEIEQPRNQGTKL